MDTSGRVLGTHRGFWHYTIGQRKGLGIGGGTPLYVLELRACRNEVVVGADADTAAHELELSACHWISKEPTGEAAVKIRSTAAAVLCRIEGSRLIIPSGVRSAAKGQSAVLYRGDEVLGGGIIIEVA